MKSVVTAAWFLNNAFGNLLVVIITESNMLRSQSSGYFFYGVWMIVCVVVFAVLAYDYLLDDDWMQSQDDLRRSANNEATPTVSPILVTSLSSNSLVNLNI